MLGNEDVSPFWDIFVFYLISKQRGGVKMIGNYENLDSFDYFQQEEIRKGLENNIDVSVYAKPELPYNIMHQLRKALEDGHDLTPYITFGVGILHELRKALKSNISLVPYVNEGYDSDQLEAIRHALEKKIDIAPYLDTAYHGACINEIAIGLEHHIDVSPYAKTCYTWRKMKEIRIGIEQRLDISYYVNPLYSYWQMHEIRLGLADGLDVSYYKSLMYTAKEMKKRRLWLKDHERPLPELNHMTIINHPDYDIRISQDGMSAYFNWHCRHPLNSAQELEFLLRRNGIFYGIDYAALSSIARTYKTIDNDTPKDQNTLIAKGTAPVDGHDGYYVFQFQTNVNRMPLLVDDNNIDFDNIKWFETVTKNQTLAIYHPSTPATDGKTVTGKTIHAVVGKEKPILTGSGFELLPDQKTYVASKNGHVQLHKYELTVSDVAILDELPSSDKPLYFNCDVYIRGSVTGPVTINVNGDLVIDGFVTGAEIHCEGNLLLKSGINASYVPNSLTAGKDVISKFFEYTTLHADGNIFFGSSLNSNLSSYGEIISYGKKGGIIGGSCYAEKGFCLPNIGNAVGVSTTLLLGSNDNIRLQQMVLDKEILNIKNSIAQLMTAYENMCKKLSDQKNSKNTLFLKLKDAIYVKNQELEAAHQKAEELKKRKIRACCSRIIVEHHVYDNVNVQYMDRKITAIPSKKVAILINNDHLVMEKIS